jgi:hypothetical protein
MLAGITRCNGMIVQYKGLNMRNLKIVTLFAGIACIFYLQAKKPEIQDVDPEKSSKVTFTFKVWHDEKFDEKVYGEIAKNFEHLLKVCQESDKDDSGFDNIVEIIGEPFKSLMSMIEKQKTINGVLNLSVKTNVDNENVSLEIVIMREDEYNKKVWTSIVEEMKEFAIGGEESVKKLAPIFTTAINTSDESGIHGSLNCGIE